MNYNENFSFKELEHLTLKATYPIEIGKRKIEPGEIIAKFDNITIPNITAIVIVLINMLDIEPK